MNSDTINDAVTMRGGEGALLAGRYRVVRQLGRGGMGSVWLVEDTQLDNKLFAIKMLPSILVSNKRAYRQLKDEALVAMKLTHPNIVTLRAFEENNGNPFLVMDYIDGETLDTCLAQWGVLDSNEAVAILKPIASALDYAHSKGVVHRDVKPGNVMVARDGTPYILDFGIAREIQETMTRVTGKLSSGTLLYMSPEQLNGEPPKPAQDVYSFAAMAYECMKGEPPFCRGQIEFQILNKQPPPLRSDGAPFVANSVMAGLAKKPEDRPNTCAAVLEGRVLTQSRRDAEGGRVGSPMPVENGRAVSMKQPRWNIASIVIPTVCVVAVLLALGGVLWHREQERKQEEGGRIIEAQKTPKMAPQQEKEDAARKAQEVEDRILKEEQMRLAAEHKAKAVATEIRNEAKVQQGKVERISDSDGFKERKKPLADIFNRADEFYDENVKRWDDAATLYKSYIEQSRALIVLDEQRQRAVSKKGEVKVSFKRADAAGAKTHARDSWNAAVKTWKAADAEFHCMEFASAAETFAKALKEFDGCLEEARNNRRIAEEKQAKEKRLERAREAERKRRFAQYSAVKVGSLVQIVTEANTGGCLGVVVANENGAIEISRGAIVFKYTYAEIANLIVRGDVDENAIMRNNLVGKWVGTTKYGTNGADVEMTYEYTFNADGSVLMKDITSFQSIRRTSDRSGTWTIAGNGTVLNVHQTTGADAGKTLVFNLIKRMDGSMEFRWDLDWLRKSGTQKNISNAHYWYDSAGMYHFEGDSKSGWSTYHIVNTETPRIMRRVR